MERISSSERHGMDPIVDGQVLSGEEQALPQGLQAQRCRERTVRCRHRLSWVAMELFSLAFFSFWLTGWSVGVGIISFMVAKGSPLMVLFLLTHGGAEVFVSRMIARKFVDAAERMVRAPVLSQDLDSVTATWRSRGLSWVLLLWCTLLGLVVMLMLLIGTWLPAFRAFSPWHAIAGVLLTAAWGYVGWNWLTALRDIRHTMARVTLTSTFDRLTVAQRGLLFEQDAELPIAGLEVSADETRLHLRSGEQTVSVCCAPGPQRQKLLDTLQESIDQAAASPFTQPEMPQALAAMRGQEHDGTGL